MLRFAKGEDSVSEKKENLIQDSELDKVNGGAIIVTEPARQGYYPCPGRRGKDVRKKPYTRGRFAWFWRLFGNRDVFLRTPGADGAENGGDEPERKVLL